MAISQSHIHRVIKSLNRTIISVGISIHSRTPHSSGQNEPLEYVDTCSMLSVSVEVFVVISFDEGMPMTTSLHVLI